MKTKEISKAERYLEDHGWNPAQYYFNEICRLLIGYASQQQPSREKIIKATEEAYDKWTRLENENVTYLGELIVIELSELTKWEGEYKCPVCRDEHWVISKDQMRNESCNACGCGKRYKQPQAEQDSLEKNGFSFETGV